MLVSCWPLRRKTLCPGPSLCVLVSLIYGPRLFPSLLKMQAQQPLGIFPHEVRSCCSFENGYLEARLNSP